MPTCKAYGEEIKLRVYVASSWRNRWQPAVVQTLRAGGHSVYDFRSPRPGDHGFHWSEIDSGWQGWHPDAFREAIKHPIAAAGFKSDMDALTGCDVCVLVLPCGRSAHLEAGWAAGAGKRLIILILEECEPELMYRMADVCTSISEVLALLTEGTALSDVPARGPIPEEAMSDQSPFETWGIVELFGHQRIAGKLTEQNVAGTIMLRVDVPALEIRGRQLRLDAAIPVEQQPAFTKFYGAGAIYGITPTDEQTARLAAASLRVEPCGRWQFESAVPALTGGHPFAPPGFGDDDAYEDDGPETDND